MKNLFFMAVFALAVLVVAKTFLGWVLPVLVWLIFFSFSMVWGNRSKKGSTIVFVFAVVGTLSGLALLVLGLIGSFLEYGAFTGIVATVIVAIGLIFSGFSFKVTKVEASEKEKK